ncbi:haloacid dehalogenase-like hydrolase domain-containing protein 2 [Diadema antillarum]|uniref:haloacid dehalogenase-like hydrolase domain-containing protein 2 n=1 Tax=Diadema antillarum TaxID=105358 RepID=UPI003A86C8F6
MATRSRLKAVLIDLSGTIHIEDLAIPGAVSALKRLRDGALKIKFVTNTTKESMVTLHHRLTKIGFNIQPTEIFSSLTAARNLVREKGCRPMLLLQDSAKEDFKGIPTENPDCVVVGLSPDSFNYDTLNTAFRLVLEGSPLIAIHKAKYYKRPDGLALGLGPFVAGLEYAAGVRASVVGKPEAAFFTEALKTLGCSPDEAVMIGDDVQGDVEGAQRANIKAILVKTGKYRPGDEAKITPAPMAVCDDFSAAVDLLLKDFL